MDPAGDITGAKQAREELDVLLIGQMDMPWSYVKEF